VVFLSLPPIGSVPLDVSSFFSAHGALVHEVAEHALAHALYSHIRGGYRGRVNRREARKVANRRRRWFVDNIIMHHKRLHDRNRELIINNAKERVLAKREKEKNKTLSNFAPKKDRNDETKWQDMVRLKERAATVRGRVDARKSRARSRWLSISEG